jgi:hypothetical protein
MYRLFAIAAVVVWLGAMAALVRRDVWPAWTAQDFPELKPGELIKSTRPQEQFGLFRGDGERIGTAWGTVSVSAGETLSITGTVLLTGLPLMLRDIRVETSTEFDAQGELDNFSLDVFGVPMTTIRVRGERHGIYFPCDIQVGPLHRQANLEMSASRMIGESLRPFTFLPSLRVGQSWRMQILDPISAAISRRAEFTSVIATVTAKEVIYHNGESIECFVVQTAPQQSKAWVDATGRVVRQEVEMPGMGRVVVKDEPYDERAREKARERVRSTSFSQGGFGGRYGDRD